MHRAGVGRGEELAFDRVLVVNVGNGLAELGQHLKHIAAVGPLDTYNTTAAARVGISEKSQMGASENGERTADHGPRFTNGDRRHGRHR